MTSGENKDYNPEKQGLIFFGSDLPQNFGDAVSSELASADEAMFIVSFIRKTGLDVIKSSLEEFTKTKRLRIITTTYLGITEQKAVDEIASLDNTEVRISFIRNNTLKPLHAKSYIFVRTKSGMPDTMFVGSSNITAPALSTNLEWNVKLSSETNPIVLKQAINKFNELWEDERLLRYDPCNKENRDDLDDELSAARSVNKINVTQRGVEYLDDPENPLNIFEILPHQRRILDDLSKERESGHYRNLVVAATGTGKTALAAFDYKRFMESNPENNKLLFVAHRDEILRQSLATFRKIIGSTTFGNLVKSKEDLDNCDSLHIFTSIQLLNKRLIKRLDPHSFDYIIIDETHHASANSYQSLFTHFEPKILLGLTATPERMDGLDIKQYFDDRIAHNLDLTTAINESILTPFTYYAYKDRIDWSNVDIDSIRISELSKLVDSKEQVQMIIDTVEDYVPDSLKDIRCLAFCADIEHAKTMCQAFNRKWKNSSITVTSESSLVERMQAPVLLDQGKIHFIFTVDIYNEGVDIQKINTVLFLRPTESLTIFIQQLGRGLRKVNDASFYKPNLTVIDFVGNYSKNYKVYANKLAYMMGVSEHQVRRELLKDNPTLPNGCKFDFKYESKEVILEYIEKQRASVRIQPLLNKFKDVHGEEGSLQEFLYEYDIDPKNMYRDDGNRTFYSYPKNYSKNRKIDAIVQFLSKLTRIDSETLADGISDVITNGIGAPNSEVYANMLFFMMFPTSRHSGFVWDGNPDINGFVEFFRSEKTLCRESLELIDYLRKDGLLLPETSVKGWNNDVLQIGCSYYTIQIMTGLGKMDISDNYTPQSGVNTIDDRRMLLTVTLDHGDEKSAFSDTAIDEYHFNWESQKEVAISAETSKRLMDENTEVLLFVRTTTKDAYGVTAPFTFLGPVSCESYKGVKPFEVLWRTSTPIPNNILNFDKTKQMESEDTVSS